MKKIVLVGHGASGKDYLSNNLVSMGYKKSVTYTTRPIRIGEVDGKDYHYISVDEFKSMIDNDEFYEYDVFKEGWYYGSSKRDWEDSNLFIKTRNGVESIKTEDRDNCIVIFLNISEVVRYKRLLERSDNNDSIDRRMEADKKDFEGFNSFDYMVTIPKYDMTLIKSFLI